MGISLAGYKVIYDEKVLQAVVLMEVQMPENIKLEDQYKKPKFIEILAINSDGNIIAIRDEAWRFQFIPRLTTNT